jgi:hypothetical protein
MLSLLSQILCAIQTLAYWIIDLLVMAINGLILAIGLVLVALVAALPNMPDTPNPPSTGVLGFINWLIPLGPMLAFAAVALLLWVTWLGIQIIARWVKLL